jgi:hypothetical protein
MSSRRVELHLAELLPHARLVVAGIDAQDDVVLALDVGAGVGHPQRVDVRLHAAVHSKPEGQPTCCLCSLRPYWKRCRGIRYGP